MWITSEVELPQAVIDAHSAGHLVFFVGAGASMGPPSSLPSFTGLARELASMARISFADTTNLDTFLGELPAGFATHAHTRALIGRAGSLPNATHTALVRLASSTGDLRIVTTNFDDHLLSAATGAGVEVRDTWFGPSLPLGDEFIGLVHLHGSVRRDPRELVLTDTDFGRAYLTRGWATRFLLPMFQEYTVVFVGYSHDDPIMRYLALGLPPRTLRFAFTPLHHAADPKWERLGVGTIGYPVVGDDHAALVAALQAWDVRARMGQTDHRSRMNEIIDAGPEMTPVDRDYLADRIATTDGARHFAAAVENAILAHKLAWLRWAEDLSGFRSIFTGGRGGEAEPTLVNWFCSVFITSPELHGAALQTVQRLGQAFSDALFRDACWAADQLGKKDTDAGRRWKMLLASSIHGHSAPVETDWLLAYFSGDHTEHVSVLRSALRPRLALKRRWFLSDAESATALPDAEARWSTAAEILASHVLKFIEATEPGDPALESLLEDALSAAYDLLDAYFGPREWDSLSFGRSAIEPHPQDEFRDPVDAVIDGLRAYGEKALPVLADLPERWWSLGRELFQRLALHLLARDQSRAPDEKISWLLDRSLIYKIGLKHEVYQVMQAAIPSASASARDRLLAAVLAGPSASEDIPDLDRYVAYAKYNALVWLTGVAPEWRDAASELEATQEANPDFAPREHPDFDRWMSSGTWGGKFPMEPDDFVQSFENDPAHALEDLVGREYSERAFDQPRWEDALSLISRVAEARPDVGEQMWRLIAERADKQAPDIRRALAGGWAKADLATYAEPAVARVSQLVGDVDSARTISRFLLEQVRSQADADETPALAAMRDIALALWHEHSTSFTHAQDLDPVSFAPLYLNSWPGELAQYWIGEIDRRWRHNRDDWSGLNEQERAALGLLLEGTDDALDATQPAVASGLFFLFAADPDFAIERVIPLFLEDATARRAWSPYLHHPRYNDKLLGAGLLEGVIAEWDRLGDLDDRLRDQFLELVASIVAVAGISVEERQALLDGSVLANDGAHAADFAEAAVRLLQSDRFDGAAVWERWLGDHVRARLAGIPRTAELEELARWADALPHLGSAIPEASGMLGGRGIGLGDRFFDPDFPDGVLLEHGPTLVEHYVERIRNSSPTGHLVPHQVRDLIGNMREVLGNAAVQPLVAAATESGFDKDY
ncbi:SIR2 family protein [Cellulomonas iranensis]|uniref:SIR2-like domain-containing protein n=1 Tax=Cellulomonas iranensis TaxID=76862 RepID=A0ABU0GIM7_9CELL|nr:SIR2 family protein [Cellulomonas iranensis]MDQ0424551.1 hypothetical protein [Cellulomonas iranensis]